MSIRHLIVLFATGLSIHAAQAQEKVLNLYSARHYSTDEALYTDFTKATGIKINRIEAGEDQLLERIKSEGAKSPADVFLTVDAGRLAIAEQLGLFQSINSKTLSEKVPEQYRLANGTWVGLSARARVIVVDKTKVNPQDIANYEDLANPRWKNQICVRSGSHVYNLSLISSIIEANGQAATETWARGLVANLARPPKGGDTDQIKAVGSGECTIALSNSYYLARLLRSTKAEDKALMANLAIITPNQGNRGTHMNVSGGGVLKNAPNPESAIAFMNYLVSDQAQKYFADGNNEWPVTNVAIQNPALEAFGNNGKFKQDKVNMSKIGAQQKAAQELVNRVGWK